MVDCWVGASGWLAWCYKVVYVDIRSADCCVGFVDIFICMTICLYKICITICLYSICMTIIQTMLELFVRGIKGVDFDKKNFVFCGKFVLVAVNVYLLL